MSSVSTAAVKDVLNDLLHAADLEVATETSIERELASKLGIDISDHRELIRVRSQGIASQHRNSACI